MAQLAESLHAMNRVDVDRAAVDMTGLKGGYDFVLTFVRVVWLLGARRSKEPVPAVEWGLRVPTSRHYVF
jgi:uncharacterized protein (TIGR03435 family)